jgi:hypothetical protein
MRTAVILMLSGGLIIGIYKILSAHNVAGLGPGHMGGGEIQTLGGLGLLSGVVLMIIQLPEHRRRRNLDRAQLGLAKQVSGMRIPATLTSVGVLIFIVDIVLGVAHVGEFGQPANIGEGGIILVALICVVSGVIGMLNHLANRRKQRRQ